jgi:tRNA U38,U39,U40 pseudouridine synthase TruA
LVGNRFLRRMIRILVATALREALLMSLLQQQDDVDNDNNTKNRLVEILKSKDRRQAARPAPPQGLIFVGAVFQEEGRNVSGTS